MLPAHREVPGQAAPRQPVASPAPHRDTDRQTRDTRPRGHQRHTLLATILADHAVDRQQARKYPRSAACHAQNAAVLSAQQPEQMEEEKAAQMLSDPCERTALSDLVYERQRSTTAKIRFFHCNSS